MLQITFRSLWAAVERWDLEFYEDFMHERFAAPAGEYDAATLRRLLVVDVVPWVRSWPADARAELGRTLGFFLAYERAALDRIPSCVGETPRWQVAI